MNNRENLLAKALELFARYGYEAVGVQQIADAAGVGKPTLYHYFGSKSGLLNTLLHERMDPFFEEFEAVAYHRDVMSMLRETAETCFAFARQDPLLYRLYLSMWFAPAESDAYKIAVSFTTRQQQRMESLFARAAEDHGNMKGRQRAYAASFLGMVHTYVMIALNGYAELDEAQVYRLIHQFMHGIFS